jgi:chromosome segregation ATPase
MSRTRTSQQFRSTTSHSRILNPTSRSTSQIIPHFGRPKPTRDIRPSEIHEFRVSTLRIEGEIKIQQTKFNRLKERILAKNEAINRTLQQKANEQSATVHQTTISQLTRSITSAENTLKQLQEELQSATLDDRTALYQELDEEVRTTYLALEVQQHQLELEKQESDRLEQQLKETDRQASPENLNALREDIERTKALNRALRKKWTAYHEKMHRMNIEIRITANRNKQKTPEETMKEANEEYYSDVERLNALADGLDEQNALYQQNVEELMGIIDGQRRRIVQFLMGRKQEQNGKEAE